MQPGAVGGRLGLGAGVHGLRLRQLASDGAHLGLDRRAARRQVREGLVHGLPQLGEAAVVPPRRGVAALRVRIVLGRGRGGRAQQHAPRLVVRRLPAQRRGAVGAGHELDAPGAIFGEVPLGTRQDCGGGVMAEPGGAVVLEGQPGLPRRPRPHPRLASAHPPCGGVVAHRVEARVGDGSLGGVGRAVGRRLVERRVIQGLGQRRVLLDGRRRLGRVLWPGGHLNRIRQFRADGGQYGVDDDDGPGGGAGTLEDDVHLRLGAVSLRAVHPGCVAGLRGGQGRGGILGGGRPEAPVRALHHVLGAIDLGRRLAVDLGPRELNLGVDGRRLLRDVLRHHRDGAPLHVLGAQAARAAARLALVELGGAGARGGERGAAQPAPFDRSGYHCFTHRTRLRPPRFVSVTSTR